MKGFLKRLLNPKSEAASAAGDLPPWHNRSPRIQIVPLHHVAFKIRDAKSGSPLVRLINLSSTGASLMRDGATPWPKEGGTLQGSLTVGEQEFELKARVVYLSKDRVGCQFEKAPVSLRRAVEQYFELELGALKLDEVRQELLQPEDDGQPHWFIASDQCELYYVEQDGRVARFHLHFFGTYMEQDEAGKLVFGKVDAGHAPGKPSAKESAIVRKMQRPGPEVFEAAIKFVRNIEKADPLARETIVKVLSQAMWEEVPSLD